MSKLRIVTKEEWKGMKVSAVEHRSGVERRKRARRKEISPNKPNGINTVLTAEKPILTTRETAELLGVTQQTIKNYIYAGKLKSVKTPGGRYRIYRSDIIKLGYLKKPTK